MSLAIGIALAKLLLQLVAIRSYGWFRDELYYQACANRLAFGYVDHPPFSIAFLRAWRAAFGDSLVAIRLAPALLGAALVLITARIVIELGGGSTATALACLAVLCAPAIVGTDHVYSMNAFDHLFWALSALCVLRSLREPTPSRWIALGGVLGLGMLNKASLLWFGAGLAAFLGTTKEGRRHLRTNGPYLAAAVALTIFAPHVLWQIRNHWPTPEFARNAMATKYVAHSVFGFLRESTLSMNPFALPLTVVGVVAPVVARSPARALSIVFVTTLAILASSRSGKAEYLNAAYPLVFAAGAVWWESFLAGRWKSRGVRASTFAMGTLLVAYFVVLLPFAIPILSQASFIAYAKRLGIAPRTTERKVLADLPQGYADMHGWDELVEATARAWSSLSSEERAHARIWAVSGGYGPAAAIEVLGAKRGLPRAISTHNNYWLWGYGDDSKGPVVLLGGPRDRLSEVFPDLVQVGTVECGYCMPFENHKPIYVARAMTVSWAELWPRLKHYE